MPDETHLGCPWKPSARSRSLRYIFSLCETFPSVTSRTARIGVAQPTRHARARLALPVRQESGRLEGQTRALVQKFYESLHGSVRGSKYRASQSLSMRTIDVPADVYDALNVPEDQRDDVLRRELARSLYRERVLSFGNARELAGLSRREFDRLLDEREIDRHYTSEDLDYAGQ